MKLDKDWFSPFSIAAQHFISTLFPPPPPQPGRFLHGEFTNHAGTRSYKLYVPGAYRGAPLPLVVMLHGCTQDPDDFASGTRMNELAEEMRCFVVYPAQAQEANPHRCWNWFSAGDQERGQGEPSIIAGIAEQVMTRYAIQRKQVYIAGLSAGGAMAAIVAARYPDIFSAVGVHSGLPFASARDLPSALSAMQLGVLRPQPIAGGGLPIIVFHGDQDSTVHPRNGEHLIAQKLHGHQRLRAAHIATGCVPDGYHYTRTTHQHANGAPAGEHWLVHGAGHAWSGGSAEGSYTDGKGPDASREMLRFFQACKAG